MSAFNWLRINNKKDFRLASRFAQREFFKFFIPKDNYVRTNEFAAIPILSPSKDPGGMNIFPVTPFVNLYRIQSVTKYSCESKKINLNCFRPENFDICFCISFDRSYLKLMFGGETVSPSNVENFLIL